MKRKEITLGELFTERELNHAYTLRNDVEAIEREIVAPIIKRIDRITNQEGNDSKYWSYALQYGVTRGMTK